MVMMGIMREWLLGVCVVCVLATQPTCTTAVVLTPPMGWNSWDCYQGNLNETGALAVAETMVKYLLPSGYDILTIDEFWYANDCGAGSGCLDSNGRPQPDATKWPSSAGGKGFKPFADKIHSMGLRLGIHTLRGSVSIEALNKNSPILGASGATVKDIATTTCPWNKNWYAVNMSHPAAQPWLDSVYGQYADWGIDLIKNDCIFASDFVEDNIKAVSNAIAKTGHPTVYSLSPGGGDMSVEFTQAKSIASYVNMYRVTQDWHGGNLDYHFGIAETMQPLINVAGLNGASFPDLDMLNPYNNASSDPEFQTQMTLWSIARSPLIYGADLRAPPGGGSWTADDFALMTHPEVLAITKNSTGNRPVSLPQGSGFIAWTATSTDKLTTYVALIKDTAISASVSFKDIGLTSSKCDIRDIWLSKSIGTATGSVTYTFPVSKGYYGALFALSNCQ